MTLALSLSGWPLQIELYAVLRSVHRYPPKLGAISTQFVQRDLISRLFENPDGGWMAQACKCVNYGKKGELGDARN